MKLIKAFELIVFLVLLFVWIIGMVFLIAQFYTWWSIVIIVGCIIISTIGMYRLLSDTLL